MGYQTGGVYIPTSTRVRGRFGQLERLFGEDIKGKAEDAESKAARLKTWSTFLGGGAKGIGTYLGTKGLTKLAGGSLANLLQQGALKGLATSNPLAMAAIIGGPALLSYLGKMAPQALPQYFGRPEDIKEGFEVDGRTSTFRSGEYKDLKGALASQRSFEKEKAAGEIPGDIWSSIKNYGTAVGMAQLGERFGGKKKLPGATTTGKGAPTPKGYTFSESLGYSPDQTNLELQSELRQMASDEFAPRITGLGDTGGLEEQIEATETLKGRIQGRLSGVKKGLSDAYSRGVKRVKTDPLGYQAGEGLGSRYTTELEAMATEEFGPKRLIPETQFGRVGSGLNDMQAEAARLYPKGDVSTVSDYAQRRAAATPITTDTSYIQPSLQSQDYPGFATPFKDSLLGRLFDFSMGDPQYRSGGSNQFHPLNYLSPQEIAARASFKPIDPFVQSAAQRGLDTPAASAVLPTATEVYDPNTDPNVLLNYVGRNKPR